MSETTTLAIIKPDAVGNRSTGAIVKRIQEAGFDIVAMKMTRLTEAQARKFYAVHKDRSFFEDLIKFMTSGPVFPMILMKNNAVEDFRKLLGATDPDEAGAGTIRREFGANVQKNAVHASDSPENAASEEAFFFSYTDRFDASGNIL